MNIVRVCFRKLRLDAKTPTRGSRDAAGWDLYACADHPGREEYDLYANEPVTIPLGLAVEIPRGYELQIRSRSGLAFREDVVTTLGVGTVDADFRGEISVRLVNLNAAKGLPYTVRVGDRVAQAVVKPIVEQDWLETNELTFTHRGVRGYGSTGR